jgi:VanZ family protein
LQQLVDLRLRRPVFWAYALAWTLLLILPQPYVCSIVPTSARRGLSDASSLWDKLAHAGGYLGLFSLGVVAYAVGPSPARCWSLGCILGVHGALTETIQCWVPTRRPDVRDYLADLTGVGLGLAAMACVRAARRVGARAAGGALMIFVIRRRKAAA